MEKCFICKKKLSFIEGYSDIERYCEKCWKTEQVKIVKIRQEAQYKEEARLEKEKFLHYICPQCGKKFTEENKADIGSTLLTAIGAILFMVLGAGFISWTRMKCPYCKVKLKTDTSYQD